MPVVAQEMYNSRVFTEGKDTVSGTLEFCVKGAADDQEAISAIDAIAPATYPGITGLVRGDLTVRSLGGGFWYGTFPYIPDGSPLYPGVGGGLPPGPVPVAPTANEPLGADFAFDLSSQTEHVTQSKATISKTKRGGGVAADFKGAIGVTSDGEVLGADRFKPYLEWSTSKTFEFVTMAYIAELSSLVGTTNAAIFYGYAAGTVMFLGASGNTKDVSKCVVTFKFAFQPNRTGIVVADGIAPIAKGGWEYLWVSYKNVDDALKLTQQPEAAYVERIYDASDYSLIGIG